MSSVNEGQQLELSFVFHKKKWCNHLIQSGTYSFKHGTVLAGMWTLRWLIPERPFESGFPQPDSLNRDNSSAMMQLVGQAKVIAVLSWDSVLNGEARLEPVRFITASTHQHSFRQRSASSNFYARRSNLFCSSYTTASELNCCSQNRAGTTQSDRVDLN